MPALILTFAELDYLLPAGSRGSVRELLHLPDSGEAAAVAGLASLLVRGLAGFRSNSINVRDDVRIVAAVIASCERWLDLVHVADDSARSMFLGAAGDSDPGVIVTAAGPGAFQIDLLDPDSTPRRRFEAVMTGLLDAAAPAALYVQRRGGEMRVAVARSADGGWKYAEYGSVPRLTAMAREEAVLKCADQFAAVFGVAA